LNSGTDSSTQPALCPTCGKLFPSQTRFCEIDGSQLMVQMPDPLIGTLLPRHYRIAEQLGRGAMSVVYSGVYEPLGQQVAIKLLKSHLVSDLQTFKRFQQEAKTAGALEHPNIVSIFDFGVTEQGVPYLIMEMVHGASLWALLQSPQSVPVSSAINIFTQTADALAYTHERGTIHRDVKPSNILVVADSEGGETVKLLDFGIAKLQNYEGNPAANLTQTGEVFGTPLYVSPEQAMGRVLDGRADIYSLGCVMYEVLAGCPPFQGPSAFDVLRMQVQSDPVPLEDFRNSMEMEPLPPALVAAIEKAMSKDPDARQQSMAELVQDLQQAKMENLVAEQACTGKGRSHTKEAPTAALRTPARELTPLKPTFPPVSAHGYQNAVVEAAAQFNTPTQPISALNISQRRRSIDSAALATSQHRLRNPLPEDPIKRSGGPRPLVRFVISSLTGIACGIGILLYMHSNEHNAASTPVAQVPVTAPATTNQTGKSAVEQQNQNQDQNRPQTDDAQVLDPAISELRTTALALYDKGDYLHADEQIAKAIAEAHLKDEPLGEGLLNADRCMIDLARPDLDRAYQSGDQAVRLLDASKHVSNKDMSYALRGFGIASARRQDFAGAETLLKRSLDLDRQTYGPNDENYAVSLTRYAQVLEQRRKFEDAEQTYRQALAVSVRCHQPGDTHLSKRLHRLAAFLRNHHKSAEARELERKARQLDSAG
jgi:serine/threonine protein kinase